MQIPLIITLSLHVLSSVFWAGSSFTLARTGGAGGEAGVRHAITLLKAEIDRDLALLGIRSISEITPDLVRKF